MGYESWKSDHISPTSIDLDHRNPRLPGLPKDATQQQIMEEIFNAGDVKEMAKSIAKTGYFPDQRVVVIRKGDGGRFIVIEGNRRVSACKCLLNPSKTPSKHARSMNRWAVQAEPFKPSFEKIPVVIAPNRLAAMHLLASRHLNKAPTIGWSRFAQGRFAINALVDGQGIGDLVEETGLTESELRGSIQEARMFELFLGLSWTAEERSIIEEDISKFPIESLSRILSSKVTSESFGDITWDSEGWLNFSWEKSQIEPFLKRLMYDAMIRLSGEDKPKLTSRTANTKKDVQKYLDELPEELKPRKSDSIVPAREVMTAPSALALDPVPKNEEKARKPKPRAKKIRVPAFPDDVIFELDNDKLRVMLEEAKSIIPEELPYATGLLMRSFLEVALIIRIKKVSKWKDCAAKYARGNAPPTLDNMLKYSETCDLTISDGNLRRSLSNQNSVPRILLNLVAHNDQHTFTGTEARDCADKILPLMRFLLKKD